MDFQGQLKRGEKVCIDSSEGPVSRLVWEDCGDAVLLCSERQFEALMKGWDAPMPIGFPRRDVRQQ